MRNISLYPVILMVLIGCSITQTVEPVGQVTTNRVCIIESPPVREGFLAELKNSLRSKNAEVITLDADAKISDCPLVVTYTARWSWDMALYMSYAEITVFKDGVASGRALYDATKGGGRLDKFVDAEPKIRELIDELFPNAFVSTSESEIISNSDLPESGLNTDAPREGAIESSSQMYERLLELEDLRNRGILTDEEFEAEKRKILERND